jgi:hypothetical protein
MMSINSALWTTAMARIATNRRALFLGAPHDRRGEEKIFGTTVY